MNPEPEKSFNFWTEEEQEQSRLRFPMGWKKFIPLISVFALILSLLLHVFHWWIQPQQELQKLQSELHLAKQEEALKKIAFYWGMIQDCQEIHQAAQKPLFLKAVQEKWTRCDQELKAFYQDPQSQTWIQLAFQKPEALPKHPELKKAFFNKDASLFWQKIHDETSETRLEEDLFQGLAQIEKALKMADPLQDTEVEANLELVHWRIEQDTWILNGKISPSADKVLERLDTLQKTLADHDFFTQVSLENYSKDKAQFTLRLQR